MLQYFAVQIHRDDSKLHTNKLVPSAQVWKGSLSSELRSQIRPDMILGATFSCVPFAKGIEKKSNKTISKESIP